MSLTMKVTRGPESWQFFAFVFSAVVILEFSLIDDFMSTGWLRAVVQVASFAATFCIVVLNKGVRNWLIGVLGRIKGLEHYEA